MTTTQVIRLLQLHLRLIEAFPLGSFPSASKQLEIRGNTRASLRVRNLLDERAPRVSSALSSIGGVHIGARGLNVLNLIWFGYITRLSHWGGGGYFTYFTNYFYLACYAYRKGEGPSPLIVGILQLSDSNVRKSHSIQPLIMRYPRRKSMYSMGKEIFRS